MYTYIEYKRREFKTDVGRNQAHDQTFTGSLGRGGSRCEMLIKDKEPASLRTLHFRGGKSGRERLKSGSENFKENIQQ